MPTPDRLAVQIEQHRAHLRAVAYRMLGSANEADDAVQEAGFDSAGPMSATSRICEVG
jgi:DNA-directed RNA polymerase specialized sigma24 family protein